MNTFEAALHSAYLCVKVPSTFGATTVCGSQKEARNIEHGFTPGQNNVHFLKEGTVEHDSWQPSSKEETPAKFENTIEAEDECKRAHRS
jgi:hypothetical protein